MARAGRPCPPPMRRGRSPLIRGDTEGCPDPEPRPHTLSTVERVGRGPPAETGLPPPKIK